MNDYSDTAETGDALWKDALPHLDDAIDHLSTSDRNVILLHFVSELTFPEIARRLGKSAAAVQKQSRRALEKLHSSLSRKGVSLSVGVLATCLASEMSKASPVLLAPALGSLSLAGKTTTTLVMKKSTIVAVASTALLCSVPLARQQISINRLEDRISSGSSSSEQTRISSRPSLGGKTLSVLERLSQDLKSRDYDLPRYLSANDYLKGLGDEDLMELMRALASSDFSSADQFIVFNEMANVLRERDPSLVLQVLSDEVPLDFVKKTQLGNLMGYTLEKYSTEDASGALGWFRTHLDFIRKLDANNRRDRGRLEREARIGLSYGLIFTAPSDAAEVLRPLQSVQQIRSSLDQFVRSREPSLRKDAGGYIQTVRELLPEPDANEALGYLVGIRFAETKFKSAEVLLDKYDFNPAETEAIYQNLGRWHFGNISNKEKGLAKAISEYREWMGSQVTDDIDLITGRALGATVKTYSNSSGPIYETLLNREEGGLSDDVIRGLLEVGGGKLGEEKSSKLRSLLSNPEVQNQ